tara:strand:- start:3056 stop:3592 length:537 start_codon:yes stop_codon:yes gene_type:complete
MFIYKLTNTVNQKIYIGKTINSVELRFKRHIYNANSGIQTRLYSSIQHYGSDAFVFETIDEALNESELNQKEIHWINHLTPEYNMTKGGDGGDTSASPNYQKNKHKCAHIGKLNGMYGLLDEHNPNYGRKNTTDTIKKMSETHINLRKLNRKTCSYCNKSFDSANYSRWHGDNCKLKT